MSSQLQNLSSQFNSLLTQYTDTYQNYINTLNSSNVSLTTVLNSSFVGESNINTINGSSLNACKKSCSSNSSCSGATFNNTLSNCTLSTGSGNIVNTPKSTAIVQEAIYYSYQLQQLNSQLSSINQQMINLANNSYNQYSKTEQEVHQQGEILNNNYQTLLQDRVQIDEMVRQFETINSAYQDGNINVTSNYYVYIVLLFVVLFLLFLLINYNLPGSQSGGGVESLFKKNHILIFLLLGFIIILNPFIKK
jgi:NADH:ubiquinone oxidoreductase subunit 3 (subunit A)